MNVRKRNRFDQKDVAAIKQYFRANIKAGTTPTLQLCKQFLKGIPMPRSPKKIQDKVRHLQK